MGNKDNAVADYKHALSIDPDNALARAGLKILGVAVN
jgi:hypothetical protein